MFLEKIEQDIVEINKRILFLKECIERGTLAQKAMGKNSIAFNMFQKKIDRDSLELELRIGELIEIEKFKF